MFSFLGCHQQGIGPLDKPESSAQSVNASELISVEHVAELVLDAITDHADLIKEWNREEETLRSMDAIEFALIPSKLMKEGREGKVAVLCLSNSDSASAAENLLAARAQSLIELGPTGVLVILHSPSRPLIQADLAALDVDHAAKVQQVIEESIRQFPSRRSEIEWVFMSGKRWTSKN
ncbi:MAG: hypothetical protein WD716_00020 [Fimbriimonadaceae bacterium]